ncbi:GspE/PulE family protein [Anaerosphaera multitolerans]|uniref:Type II/IV secretion system protein n=1 Tax=Anaerosphaera multitolerans TaxID=2487351 RepID=A0A437S897_9FIRM|nr:GspE/PulE family protein [Anaerosphaera multitolerans]RVU55310.1 type II/IV secretion system protein [Anaerosphaera multitolerans]
MCEILRKKTLEVINIDLSMKYDVVPISEDEDSIVFWSLEDDQNTSVLLRIITGKNIVFKICSSEEIVAYRNKVYGKKDKSSIINELNNLERDISLEDDYVEDLTDSPIVRFLNLILNYAIENNGSDVHIDSDEEGALIRIRIDGVLMDLCPVPQWANQRIHIRTKVLCNLDYTVKNIPQDGRFTYKYMGKNIDIRVAITPTSSGGKIVFRILNKESIDYSKSGIGLEGNDLYLMEQLTSQPSGLLLICGPTNSGKTSTLYALLKSLKSDEINIMTVEDPVEYKIEGINQIEIEEKVGLDFESGLRAILRLDPDIIMVGEIRSLETADIAIKSSISGRLVFSTIHANSSVSAIYRLLDMGIDNYLLSAGVIGIVSQRLVRKLCNCKRRVKTYVDLYGEYLDVCEPVGCSSCYNGYSGRRAVFEILVVNEELRQAINKGSSLSELKSIAEKGGMVTLKDAMKVLLLKGETSVEEIYKNLITIGV